MALCLREKPVFAAVCSEAGGVGRVDDAVAVGVGVGVVAGLVQPLAARRGGEGGVGGVDVAVPVEVLGPVGAMRRAGPVGLELIGSRSGSLGGPAPRQQSSPSTSSGGPEADRSRVAPFCCSAFCGGCSY